MAVKGVRTEQAKTDNGSADKASGSSVKKATAAAADFCSGIEKIRQPCRLCLLRRIKRIIKKASADNRQRNFVQCHESNAPKAQNSITDWLGDNLWTVLVVLAGSSLLQGYAWPYTGRKAA